MISRPGAGDCSSNVAVMLELLNSTVASLLLHPTGPKHQPQLGADKGGATEGALGGKGGEDWGGGACGADVLFVFNTGEEEGLLGSHAFITQVGQTSAQTSSGARLLYCFGLGLRSGLCTVQY